MPEQTDIALELDDVEYVVLRSISTIFIESIQAEDGRASVYLRENDVFPDYYLAGDKLNKILAIESVRWLRDLPALEYLTVSVNAFGKTFAVGLDRIEVEQYLGDLAAMHPDESLDLWRRCMAELEHGHERAAFVERFATT